MNNDLLLWFGNPDFPRSGDSTPKFKVTYLFIELSYGIWHAWFEKEDIL